MKDAKKIQVIEANIRYLDLFCGLGGFRIAVEQVCQNYNLKSHCIFASDIDKKAQDTYELNFQQRPLGDITAIREWDIPDHDLLFAGFPCQPFSIIGNHQGFDDIRGTLFFDIARILKAKQPPAFILENVKQLKTHDRGKTIQVILKTLNSLGYITNCKILNALDFGLPQKRERTFIVGFRKDLQVDEFRFPLGKLPMIPLSNLLEQDVSDFYYVSETIRKKRLQAVATQSKAQKYQQLSFWDTQKTDQDMIWHENKSGNIGIHPFSCALRSGASYNYLLVNGQRRLTEREMLRLQGFPDIYKLICSYSEARKQIGNSVPVPVVAAIIESVLNIVKKSKSKNPKMSLSEAQSRLNEIIKKARTDLYKPIQIAEVLRRSRIEQDIDIQDKTTYQNLSLRWRDEVTLFLFDQTVIDELIVEN
ncbi:HaeII family restriction endonuclease [Spirulina sp. CS-785/01]|nr:HaeII family restriction endonuclease [Spirulina sp. CS-785/01]MDB9315424.1 HaeII family restriction endonuclease [Spirulina sp. CS-785/01]